MAEENIDNTVNGTGLFNTKIPGLSDAADIQAALRLYHYGTYTYDGANTDPSILPVPSMAKHLQSLVDADAAEVVNRNAAISTHNSDTTDVHGIENTANLATTQYVDTAVTNAINGAVDGYAGLAGTGLDWNSVDSRFDVEPRIANQNTVITKTNSFILDVEDVSKTILLNTSSTMNLTIPLNSSVAIPIGYKYNVIEIGSGVTTFVPSSGVTVNSKNSQLFIDTQYGQVTLLKIDTDSWIAYGDIYEGASTPTPVTPVPVHVDPVAPTPTTPTPAAPTPVTPTPVGPTPVTPVTPVAPFTPTAPVTPVGPTPVAPVTVTCNGAPESYTATFPTCNGEDTYEGIFQGTRKLCSDGSYEIITEAAPGTGTFIGFGNCIATNVSACGGSGGAGSPCGTPTPVAPVTPTAPVTPVAPVTPTAPVTPVAPVASTTYYACCSNGASVSGSYADSGAAVSGLNSECDANEPGIGNSVVGGVYTTPQNCGTTPTPVAPVAPTPVAPTPVAPTPVAPTPVAPTPVAPTPVAPTPVQDCTPVYSYTEYRAACGGPVAIYVNPCTGAESYNCPSPTPVAPTPVAPTPVAPTPVAPTPVAPTPVAPTPVVEGPFFPYFTLPGVV